MRLLQFIADSSQEWKIDYAAADTSETFEWARADMVVRTMRALTTGRTVFFLGREYRFYEGDDPEAVVGEIEDAISGSGFNVFVETDDQSGVHIGTAGPEKDVTVH